MPAKLPTIYIPNKGPHDFSTAETLGTLKILSQGKIPINSIGAIYRAFAPVISTSSPDDYILICGPTTMNVLLCGLFILKHRRLNLLIWTIRRDGEGYYQKRNLVFNTDDITPEGLEES